jgi:hypothetical protein
MELVNKFRSMYSVCLGVFIAVRRAESVAIRSAKPVLQAADPPPQTLQVPAMVVEPGREYSIREEVTDRKFKHKH